MYGVWCCTRGLEGNVYHPDMQTKGIRRECANYRGVCILRIYRRVLISKVMESTKEQVAEEQGGFRSGRECAYLYGSSKLVVVGNVLGYFFA